MSETVTTAEGVKLTIVGGKPEQPEPRPAPKDNTMAKLADAHRQAKFQAFENIGKVEARIEKAKQEVARLETELAAATKSYERIMTMDALDFSTNTTKAERAQQEARREQERKEQQARAQARLQVERAQARLLIKGILVEAGISEEEATRLAAEWALENLHTPEEIANRCRRYLAEEMMKEGR